MGGQHLFSFGPWNSNLGLGLEFPLGLNTDRVG
jgi:hypothetical protein